NLLITLRCLHSMCIPGKHIERVAIKQSIGEIFDNGDVDHIYILTIICYNVKRLDLSFNRITEFNKLYDILLNTKLQILNMSFNDIEYLKDVNDNTSIILSNSILEVLDLSNNKLTLLTIQWVLTPSLRVLNCSYNQIRNVYFSGFLLYGNASQLSILNLANNRDLTFEQNIFDSLTGLTEIDLSATNLPSDSLPENAATFCKLYLNRNSLWEYVRFTCKYNSEYEIYLSGNHIQNVRSVKMFYATSVLDISHNLLEDLLGSDCQDISQTTILNVSSNRIDIIDDSFSQIMIYLEELDLSNNPLKNIQRYDISANTRLRKLILANSYLHEIDINISLPWNAPLIDLRGNSQIRRINVITESICQYRFAWESKFITLTVMLSIKQLHIGTCRIYEQAETNSCSLMLAVLLPRLALQCFHKNKSKLTKEILQQGMGFLGPIPTTSNIRKIIQT
ncbi:hypothetical protein GJ496_005616, partial [Pomphorhynchus laevis]